MAPPYDLLDRMRRSKTGWRARDLERLYVGFGFRLTEGAKHTLYRHPKHKELRATVKWADPIPTGYVVTAVRLVDAHIALQSSEADNAESR